MNKILIIFLCMFLTACGTLTKPKQEEVVLHTSESCSSVRVDGTVKKNFEGKLEFSRKKASHIVSLYCKNKEPINLAFNRTIDPVSVAGDFLLLVFPLTLGIDFYTGAIYKIEPTEMRVNVE